MRTAVYTHCVIHLGKSRGQSVLPVRRMGTELAVSSRRSESRGGALN